MMRGYGFLMFCIGAGLAFAAAFQNWFALILALAVAVGFLIAPPTEVLS